MTQKIKDEMIRQAVQAEMVNCRMSKYELADAMKDQMSTGIIYRWLGNKGDISTGHAAAILRYLNLKINRK